MRGSNHVLEVARWEFLRFVKPKQQLAGMLVTVVLTSAVMLLTRVANRDNAQVRDIAVIGAERLPLPDAAPSFRFSRHDVRETDQLRAQVRARTLDALLVIGDAEHATLIAVNGGRWIQELRILLAAAHQQHATMQAGLSPDVVARILTPPTLDVTYEVQRVRGRGERIAVIVVLSLMLMTVFIGMSYIFASITGEKQIRVTEQVVSAIPAQTWIDGKIVGLIGVSLVGMLAQVLSIALVYLMMRVVFDSPALPLPDSLGNPLVIALILLYALLGLCFWFGFLGAIAAMIDDPQSSTRGSLLFVPVLASCLAFLIIGNPDSGLARALALAPPTAPAAMPARLLTTEVHSVEIALSVALLIAGVIVLRVAAGRVFRLAMLMYGKEPTWSEVRRWIART